MKRQFRGLYLSLSLLLMLLGCSFLSPNPYLEASFELIPPSRTATIGLGELTPRVGVFFVSPCPPLTACPAVAPPDVTRWVEWVFEDPEVVRQHSDFYEFGEDSEVRPEGYRRFMGVGVGRSTVTAIYTTNEGTTYTASVVVTVQP